MSIPAFAMENTACDIDMPIRDSQNVTVLANDAPMEVGELKAITQLKDGSTLYIKLVESEETADLARSSTTTTRTYMIQVETFGQLRDAYSIESTCVWQRQGFSSVIDTFFNTYTIYDSNFSCSWGERFASDLACRSVLNVTSWKYGNGRYTVFVNLAPQEPPVLHMDYDYYRT